MKSEKTRLRKNYKTGLLFCAIGSGVIFSFRISSVAVCAVFTILVFFSLSFIKMSKDDQIKKEADKELILYMEQILCSFMRRGNITKAWKDCIHLFGEESIMYRALKNAEEYIEEEHPQETESRMEGACSCIQSVYDDNFLRLFHEYLCRMEENGEKTDEKFGLLFDTVQFLRKRIKKRRILEKEIMKDCFVSVFLSCILCGFSRIMISGDFDLYLSGTVSYQCFASLCLVLLFSLPLVCRRMITESPGEKEKRWERRKWMKCDRILRFSCRGVRRRMAEKYMVRRMEREFPLCFFILLIHLEKGSLYRAIVHAVSYFDDISRHEWKRLAAAIYKEPCSPLPYNRFFYGLESSEIRTAMRLLYAASERESKEVKKQLYAQAEEISRIPEHNRVCHMEFFRELPFVIAGIKVVTDMLYIFAASMAQYGL